MVSTVLCPLNGSEAARPVLETAMGFARDVGFHLEVLHVRPDAKDTIPLLGEGMSVAMVEDMIGMADEEAASRSTRARAMFDDVRQALGVAIADQPNDAQTATTSWVEEAGREDEIVARRGRLNDLVVALRPFADADVSATVTLNAALFETGRPALVIPPAGAPGFGKRVAISWNGSAQSAKAVSAARRVLGRADHVLVLVADSPRTAGVRADELANYLKWHGVSADTRTFEGTNQDVPGLLLEECKKVEADLLVMGAYTHSRMRQLILGGVTRHVLDHADIPLFMAH